MIRECSAALGQGAVRYLEAGSGWPLVLLHAFPLSADMWRPQLERVPPECRMIAPDLRGFGAAPSGVPSSLDDMAADILDLLDALRIERATIAGLSMGGYVAFALYRLAPERCMGLVLANTRAGVDSEEARAKRDAMSALVNAQGPAAVADAMLPTLLGPSAFGAQPALVSTVRALTEANTARGLDAAIQAIKRREDATPLLPRISLPALVVAGDEDAIIPRAESEEMNRLLPRSNFVLIPQAGHLSALENPDDFAEALGNFLMATF